MLTGEWYQRTEPRGAELEITQDLIRHYDPASMYIISSPGKVRLWSFGKRITRKTFVREWNKKHGTKFKIGDLPKECDSRDT